MIDDLDVLWPEKPKTSDLIVPQSSSSLTYYPMLFMTEQNRTLFVANNRPSGWQRNIPMTISLVVNPLIIETSTASEGTIGKPAVFLWLCPSENLNPLKCRLHGCPFYDVRLEREKLVFRFNCGMRCFTHDRFWLVVVEYDGGGDAGFKWGAVEGSFRQLESTRAKTEPINNTLPLHLYYAIQQELTAIRESQEMLRQEISRIPKHQQQQQQRVATCMRPEDGSGHEFRAMNDTGRYLFCYNCGKIVSPYT